MNRRAAFLALLTLPIAAARAAKAQTQPAITLNGAPVTAYDVMNVPPTYPATPWPATARAMFATANDGRLGATAAGWYSQAGQSVNGASPYGGNIVVGNRVNPGIPVQNDGFDGAQTGLEIDLEIVPKSDGSAPRGVMAGLKLVNASQVNPDNSVAILVESLGPDYPNHTGPILAPFLNGVFFKDGATWNGINLGALDNAPSSDSQTIILHAKDVAGADQYVTLQLLAGGELVAEFSSGRRMMLA